ncbi:MAG: hypothetical protein IJ002_05590 [Clostridia bacterium]|nr:hypothetical protein [Clostridia bacterium]
MNNKTKQHIVLIIFTAILITIAICVADYFNVFANIGIDTANINFDFLSIFISNLIVILLFVITYLIVDARNIQKEKNQQETAYITLMGIYERCKDMVELFSQEELRNKAVEKIDGDKLLFDDKPHMHYLNYPFENETIIYSFAGSGVFSKSVFEEFVLIKKEYQKYINVALIFYDHYNEIKQIEINLSNQLSNAIEKIKKSLEEGDVKK